MLRLLGRRAASAYAELTTIHQWRIRPGNDPKPDPLRTLQKGFCVGVLPDGVERNSEAFSSNSVAMEGILSDLRSHIKKVNHFCCLIVCRDDDFLTSVDVLLGVGWWWGGGCEAEHK